MIFKDAVTQAEKANGTSAQGRNNAMPGFDTAPMMVNPIQLFSINMAGLQSDGIPQWSYYPQIRDMYLRQLWKKEPIISGALYSTVSRSSSLSWKLNGGRNQKAYYQKLFTEADGGAGYAQFISKIVTDVLTQDNGAFVEVVGPGRSDKPLVGRPTELWHLDSHQCWRTFDKDYPVIYIDPMNNSYHRMHSSRIIMLSSHPQPDERGRNVGYCAVSRVLKMMQTMRHIQTYKEEKISGKFKRGFIYGNGLTDKQFKQATEVADANAENSNFMVYNEIPVLLSMMQDMKLNMLDLASLPDGFNYKEEIDTYVYIVALCFGVDAREFWPATASGATKADASVQHMKSQGKGIADIIKQLETAWNFHVMPSNGSCEFEYDNKDDEQDKAKADIDTVLATNIATYQTNGWITPQEGRALAIAQGLIDPKQLVVSEDNDIADDSAPMEDANAVDTLQTAQPGQVDSFDMTGGKAITHTIDGGGGSGKFTPQLHPRSNNGQFGGGGGASKPAPATKPTAAPSLSPMATQLQAFLKSIGMAGKFENGTLTVPKSTKNKSAALRKYLRAHGFPNAKVVGKKTGDGYTYTIQENPPPKKTRKVAASGKAADHLISHVDEYQAKLKKIADDFVSQVAESPDDYDNAVDDLYDEFADLLPGELTDAFGIGLAGEQPTKDGIDRLKKVAQTSHDYFKDSFMTALGAVSLAGLGADEIRTALSPFVDRLGMYAGAFWESIWQGQRDAVPASTRVRRVLQAGAQHCATCPDKAGDYESYDDMIAQTGGIPGDGSDDCLSNCRCTLETEDEGGGFSPLVGSPTVFVEPLFEVLK